MIEVISNFTVPFVFWVILGFALFMYIALDGYDLGIGMLMPVNNKKHCDKMVGSIGPFWDANETWLILIVGLLLIAFPTAHSLIFTECYLATFTMICGLMARGLAFEMRVKAKEKHQPLWENVFKYGSLATSITQGYMLGRYLTGYAADTSSYVVIALVTLGLPIAYILIGASWVYLKTTQELQAQARTWFKHSNIALHIVIGIGVMFRLINQPDQSQTELVILFCICAINTTISYLSYKCIQNETTKCITPFLLTIALFAINLTASYCFIFPDVVPNKIQLMESSSIESLKFLLKGAVFIIPTLLASKAMVYFVFRGKSETLKYD